MAMLQSLGKHRPTGLDFLVTEGLLAQDPLPSSYQWIVYGEDHGCETEEEVIYTASCVVWSRGGINRRVFRFEHEGEDIQQALLTWFTSKHPPPTQNQVSGNGCNGATSAIPEPQQRSRGLVLLLRHQAHIFFLDGNDHTVNIPFEVERIFPAPQGILIQRKTRKSHPTSSPVPLSAPPNSFWSSQIQPQSSQSINDPFSVLFQSTKSLATSRGSFSIVSAPRSAPPPPPPDELPTIFTLTDPVSELGLAVEGVESLTSNSGMRLEPLGQDESVLYVTPLNECYDSDDKNDHPLILILTANQPNQTYSLWHASYAHADSLARQETATKAASTMTPSRLAPSKKRRSYAARMSTGAGTPALRGGDAAELARGRPSQPSFELGKSASQRLSESFMLDQDYETDFPTQDDLEIISRPGRNTRSTRRTSSMLARAELSSQDQHTFSDLARLPSGAGNSFGRYSRRPPSFGYGSLSKSRMSGRASSPGSTSFLSDVEESVNQDANNVDFLEDLMASANLEASDRAAFRSTKGLKKELVLVKALTIPFEQASIPIANAVLEPDQDTGIVVFGPRLGLHNTHIPPLHVWIVHRNRAIASQLAIPLQKTTLPRSTSALHPQMLIPSRPFSVYRHPKTVDVVKVVDRRQARAAVVLQATGSAQSMQVLADAASRISDQPPPAQSSIELNLPDLLQTESNALQSSLSTSVDGKYASAPSMNLNSLCQPGSLGCFSVCDSKDETHRLQLSLHPRQAQAIHLLALVQRSLAQMEGVMIDVGAIWAKVKLSNGDDGPTNEWTSSIVTLLVLVLFLTGKHRESAFQGISRLEQSSEDTNGAMQDVLNSLEGTTAWSWCVHEITSSKAGSRGASDQAWLSCLVHARDLVEQALKIREPFWSPLMVTGAAHQALMYITAAVFIFTEESRLSLHEASQLRLHHANTLLRQIAHWFSMDALIRHCEKFQSQSRSIDQSAVLSLDEAFEQVSWPSVYEHFACLPDLSPQIIGHLRSFISLSRHRAAKRDAALPSSLVRRAENTTVFDDLELLIDSGLPSVDTTTITDRLTLSSSGDYLVETLPQCLSTEMRDNLNNRRSNPPTQWPQRALSFVGREDLRPLTDKSITKVETEHLTDANKSLRKPRDLQSLNHSEDHTLNSGYHHAVHSESLLRHIFRDDKRWSEAARLIDPVKVAATTFHPSPNQTESAFLEAQKEVAQKVYQRTMALPSGQAVMRFGVNRPIMTEKIKVSTFNTTCKIQPSNNSVNADKSNFTEEKVGWAFFHAGVNAGLQVSKDAPGIDTSWLVLNKPNDLGNRHAGLLLGLGLNGHLKRMARWLAFKYLTSKHTMTSVGLLLGLSASNLGTQDSLVTRLISVHVTRLLPPGAAQLNISPLTQTAGIMGVGLLYHNTQHRRMTEVMISELEYIDPEEPAPGNEGVKDESYRFAAGCSLGLINLGMGADIRALHDMGIVSRLLTIATGPRQIKSVHVLDQAIAGATLALAMIFMKTHDDSIASKIDALDAAYQFDSMRPDILLLRTVAKWLIMWHDIEPSLDWIERHSVRPEPNTANALDSDNIPAYNIRAGLCWAIALKHAGSANQSAIQVLRHYLHWTKRQLSPSQELGRKHTFDESLTLDTLHRFQQLLALSLATICAGTGDLQVLRELRAMHGEIVNKTFGLHQATHMAIGILFIGHGRCTFGTSNLAIAVLLISLYPVFPRDVMDGRAHLQALRHLWTLAVEERCLIPRVGETGEVVVVPIEITLKPTAVESKEPITPSRSRRPKHSELEPKVLRREAPCHLPALDTIAHVTTLCPDFYSVTLDFEHNAAHLDAFKRHQSIFLQRRPLISRFGSSFGASLAKTELKDADKSDALKAVEWAFNLDVFKKLGIDGVAEGVVNVGLGKENGKVGTLCDLRTTNVDDALSLFADAQGGRDVNRLLWLRKLLEKEDTGGEEGEKWLKREWVDALKGVVAERARREGGSGEGGDGDDDVEISD